MLKFLGVGAGVVAIGGGTTAYGFTRKDTLSSLDADKCKKLRFVVAGGSISGLTVAASLLRTVPGANITVIEPKKEHHYQPGYTLVAAGVYHPTDIIWDQKSLFLPGMRWVRDHVETFDPDNNRVITRSGDMIEYDYLVVGLGVEQDYSSVENYAKAIGTPHVANMYDLALGMKFKDMARAFERGKAVFTYPTGFVKCGGAPQKITWLSEDLWRSQGNRENIDIHFYSPQKGIFPIVPKIDKIITPMIEARGVTNHFNHTLRAIDISTRTAILEESLADGTTRELRQPYDLLHPMPRFRTPKPLRESSLTAEGLGGQIDVDRQTLRHKRYGNIFGVGDCAATGAPKTAATVRKQAPAVVGNLIDLALNREPSHLYDGTSGCPLLTRYGRCMMFEFDYSGNLVNEWLYQSTKETRRWWNFKVYGLKPLYRHVMIKGYV